MRWAHDGGGGASGVRGIDDGMGAPPMAVNRNNNLSRLWPGSRSRENGEARGRCAGSRRTGVYRTVTDPLMPDPSACPEPWVPWNLQW